MVAGKTVECVAMVQQVKNPLCDNHNIAYVRRGRTIVRHDDEHVFVGEMFPTTAIVMAIFEWI